VQAGEPAEYPISKNSIGKSSAAADHDQAGHRKAKRDGKQSALINHRMRSLVG
jgi:hypothetical protein